MMGLISWKDAGWSRYFFIDGLKCWNHISVLNETGSLGVYVYRMWDLVVSLRSAAVEVYYFLEAV